MLAENDKVIERIGIDCGLGMVENINDYCIDVLMDPSALPKLRYLSLGCEVNAAKKKEFETKRPNVEFYTCQCVD